MSSFISDGEKSELSAIFGDIHDTFKRAIYAYVDGPLTIISHDPNYSSVYGSPVPESPGASIDKTPITFYGRILHGDGQKIRLSDVGDDMALKLKMADGTVRVKVDSAGKDILDRAKKIEVDGYMYEKDSTSRPHGLFTPNFYTFFLRRLD